MLLTTTQEKSQSLAMRQAAWKLKALRINKGWSIPALAEISGLAPNTIARAERAENIHEQSQKAIAVALGLEPLDIWSPETQGIGL